MFPQFNMSGKETHSILQPKSAQSKRMVEKPICGKEKTKQNKTKMLGYYSAKVGGDSANVGGGGDTG